MASTMKASRFLVALLVASASASAATGALAETVTLDCVGAAEKWNTCPSHWVINGDAQTVTWHWCDSPDTT